jgi:DNA-binding MarR family transcriptional regulator
MQSYTERRIPRAKNGALPNVGLGILLREANIAFNRVLRAKLAEHGITFGQFQHLRHLWDEDGLSQVELSRRIGIEKASSTSVIDSLEKAALIRRKRNPNDRRKLNVYLTEAGARLKKDLWACAETTNAIARAGLSPEQIRIVFDSLETMIRNLEAESLGAEDHDLPD